MKLSNSMLKNVVVSPEMLGDKLRLCGIKPYYRYQGDYKTDEILGYAYTVICYPLDAQRLDIKVPGAQRLTVADMDRLVHFDKLQIGIYTRFLKNAFGIEGVYLKATASDVTVAD